MFVSASSATAPTNTVGENSIGDISPAQFRVLFNEPIRLKNADIEVVYCKVKKRNEIIVTESNNKITFRIGDEDVAEQYTTRIPPGNYSTDQYCLVLERALNETCAMNIHKGGFSCVNILERIQVTYTQNPLPPATNFRSAVLADPNFKECLFVGGINYSPGVGTDSAKSVLLSPPYGAGNPQQQPFNVPNETFEYCGSTDMGTEHPCHQSFIAKHDWGVWENNKKGGVEAIVRPTNCITKSVFDVGFDGWSGTTAKPQYLTMEFLENFMDDGVTPVPTATKYGSMQSGINVLSNRPKQYTLDPNRPRQINGILNKVYFRGDKRGTPYNKQKDLLYPPSWRYATMNGVVFEGNSREVGCKSSWSGTLEMNGPNTPQNYSFQLDGSFRSAQSLCKRVGEQQDKVRVRLSQAPLIAGLPQQINTDNSWNYTTIDTSGASGFGEIDILKDPIAGLPTVPKLFYNVGSVGEMNYGTFGGTYLAANTQAEDPVYGFKKNPYYKILEIDVSGNPTKLCVVDSGEYIIPTAADLQNTSLFLNDPATFTRNEAATSEYDLMDEAVFRVCPAVADIGTDEASDPTTTSPEEGLRYASTSLGIVRDQVYCNCVDTINQDLYNMTYVDELGDWSINQTFLQFSKDMEITVESILEDLCGNPIADPNGTLSFNVYQYQPGATGIPYDPDFPQLGEPCQNRDMISLCYNATPITWGSMVGTGSALADWTTFPGVTDPSGAVKISININDGYEVVAEVKYTTDFPGSIPFALATTRVLSSEIGTNRTDANGNALTSNISFLKQRMFPVHPILNFPPASVVGNNEPTLQMVGSEYPQRYDEYPGFKGGSYLRPFEANNVFMTNGCAVGTQAPGDKGLNTINAFNSGAKPRIMMKSQILNQTQLTSTIPPPNLKVLGQDYEPKNGGSINQSGLKSVMYTPTWGPGTSVDFPINAFTHKIRDMGSFVIEIPNLPLNGYIGKVYGNGEQNQEGGVGCRLPIVGMFPLLTSQEKEVTEPIINYAYKPNYPQKVSMRLPAEQFFYNLDFNLRDVLSGKILNNLLHKTEVGIRIYPLDDNLENNIRR